MRDEVAKVLMIVAAGACFFALVHPWAPDPIAVGKIERLADAVAPAPTLLPTLTLQVSTPPGAFPRPEMPLMSLDITEEICVLNC